MEYRTGRHVVSALHVHLVFVTKYRRGVLDDAAIEHLQTVFHDICDDFGATLKACDGEDDHVHLLVEYPATVTPSRLVNSLKGVGSRLLLRDRPDLREYAKKGLWSPSYFAASCGGAPIEIVRNYVANQRLATDKTPYPSTP